LCTFSEFVLGKTTTNINKAESSIEYSANGTWQMISFQKDSVVYPIEEVEKWKIKNDG